MKERFKELREGYPALSLRSLALYRACLGALAAYAILRRWIHWHVFYAADGVYPGAALSASSEPSGSFWAGVRGALSLLEGVLALQLVFAITLAIALSFAFGVAMRFTRWLLFPAIFIVHMRAPGLLTGAEGVMHHQALLAALLPWGALDKRRRDASSPDAGPPDPSTHELVRTWIHPLILAQLALVYLITALTKSGEAWMSGMAVYRAFASPMHSTAFGGFLAEALPMPALKAMNYGALLMEAALPFLLLTPFARRRAHALAALLMVALHGGILVTLEVGVFSAAMLVHLPLLWHPPRGERQKVLERPRQKRILEAALLVALLYLALARAAHDNPAMSELPRLPLAASIERASSQLGLAQLWQMFAPEPPAREKVLVVEAHTASGRVFDPWRAVARGEEAPLRRLERSSVDSRLFASYDFMLHSAERAWMAPYFSRWVLSQGDADDRVERFDAWFILASTESRARLIPDEALDEALRAAPLALEGALQVHQLSSRGVWAPERAIDGMVAPEGTHSLSPIATPMSAGCPLMTLDLGEPRSPRSALIQAAAVDHFYLEGSLDGERFELLGEAPRLEGRGLRARVVSLEGEWRYIRLRPAYSRSSRHHLAEIAIFEREISLEVKEVERKKGQENDREVETEGSWFYSRERPSVLGALSASMEPDPSCPAEALAKER